MPTFRAALLLSVALVTMSSAALAQRAPSTPDAAARQYLERGAAGDTAAVRGLIMERCEDTPVGRVEAVQVMGVRMTIRTIRVQVLSSSPTEARVRYSITGSAQGNNATTRILGATVRIGRVRVANVTQSNVLRLQRVNGQWLVACR
jgi:hypothetical protein